MIDCYDVVVIGAGSAGLAAALTAGRAGARVLLVERYGYAGGMGTAALVHTFCGLYLLRQDAELAYANPGIASEIAERMIAATGIGPQRMGQVDVLPQQPQELVKIADQLLEAESSLSPWFHTELISAALEDHWHLTLATRGSLHVVRAHSLIDASGDAVVARAFPASTALAPRLQRPAYIFQITGLTAWDEPQKLATAGSLVEGFRAGALPKAALALSFRCFGTREGFGTIDLDGGSPRGDYDPLDPRCLSQLEISGRRIATAAIAWLRSALSEWREVQISQWPLRAGVRESRRWIGEATLTGDDLLHSRRFPDELALASWPMEFRETIKGPKLRYPHAPLPAGIRAGCLQPKGLERLWIAGRCISTDHAAHASIRVMGTCFATGEAAGRLAAHAASTQ